MKVRRRTGAAAALATTAAVLLAACSSGDASTGSSDSPDGGGDVTLTWWHNGTEDPLNSFWQTVADEFEAANPGVTVEIEAIQNEDVATRIAVALQSGDAPSLFQQWGGGEMAQQAAAGHLMDLTGLVDDELAAIGGTAAPWSVDGTYYGLPFQFGIEGIWYRPSLFEQAGITEEPATMDELYGAVDKLKAAGITPIAVGAADQWPAAHWWFNFALRSCTLDTINEAGANGDFSDPCFVTAGEKVEELLAAEPFQEGFAGTSAQQGATSSAGLVATGNAAMELMGHWNVFVMTGLVDDPDALTADLDWFPFPEVEGAGDPTAAMGGGDGFSCYVDAPAECVDLLKYILSEDVQTRFAEVVGGVPVIPAAASGVSQPTTQEQIEVASQAAYVQLWMDIGFGPNVGGALNDTVEAMFSGQATAADIPAAMQAAADNG